MKSQRVVTKSSDEDLRKASEAIADKYVRPFDRLIHVQEFRISLAEKDSAVRDHARSFEEERKLLIDLVRRRDARRTKIAKVEKIRRKRAERGIVYHGSFEEADVLMDQQLHFVHSLEIFEELAGAEAESGRWDPQMRFQVRRVMLRLDICCRSVGFVVEYREAIPLWAETPHDACDGERQTRDRSCGRGTEIGENNFTDDY